MSSMTGGGDPLLRLAGTDPAGLPAAAVAEEITAAVRYLDRLTGQVLRWIAALDASGGADVVGCASTVQFARQFLRMLPHNAKRTVATARALRTMGATAQALQDGAISADHTAVIAHAATRLTDEQAAAAEPVLVTAATSGATPQDVRQLGSTIRHRVDPDGADRDAVERYERRYLSVSELMDGSWRIDGNIDAGQGLAVKTAIEAFAVPAGAADTRTPGQRRADGLAAACKAALDTGALPERHEVRPHVSLLVERRTLSGDAGAPPATTGYRTHLTAEVARGYTCDSTASRITVDSQGLPLDVGRAVRVISPGLRRAVEARDQGCRWPGCDQPAVWASPHHIVHWARGGKTSLDNLILLCFAHHIGFVHTAGWTITGHPNTATYFTSPDGRLVLTNHPPGRLEHGQPRPPSQPGQRRQQRRPTGTAG